MATIPTERNVSLVLPALNEAGGIGPLVRRCKDIVKEVIVVDGNSTDGTSAIAEKEGAKVIVQPKRGYGLALRTGFEAAACDIIACADADGTYPVEKIPEIVKRLVDEDLDFISCSRFPLVSSESMESTNKLGNRALSMVGTVLWMHNFQDILSGMWIMKKSSFQKMELHSINWNLSQEIKLEAYDKFGAKFKEHHIPYFERIGEAKLSPWKVGFQNLTYFFIHRAGLRKVFDQSK